MADDPPRSDSETALRSFLIADVRGYTRYTREHGDEAASQLAARFAGIVRETAAAFGGELLELRGDEALCVFISARRAVRAAVDLQRRLREPSEDGPALPLGVGIGIDAGEAVPTEGGYRGGALNLAARMCAVAAPGQILTSQGLVHLAGHVDGITFGQPRDVSLKGMGNRVSVVEVLPDQPLPPLPPAPPPEPRQRRRPPAWLLVTAAMLLLAAIAGAVLVSRHGDGVAAAPMSIAEIDPISGQVLAVVPLQSAPDQIAAGAGALWVGEENRTLVRVDTASLEVSNVEATVAPTALAFGDGTLWIYDADSARLGTVDPSGVTQPQSSPAPKCPFTAVQECLGGGLAVGEGAVWVGHGYGGGAAGAAIGSVWKLDPDTLHTVARVFRVPADRITTGGGSVWTFGRVGELGARIEPVAARPFENYRLTTNSPALDQPGLTYAFGHVWFVSSSDGVLFQYELDGGTPRTVSVGAGAHDVAATSDSLWLTSSSGTISRVDPFSLQVVTTRDLGYQSSCIAYSNGRIWVGLGSAN